MSRLFLKRSLPLLPLAPSFLSPFPPPPFPSPSADNSARKQILDYLHPPPHSGSPIPPLTAPAYKTATITTLVERLQPFQLTKSEILMILNLRPLDLGLLDCVVEECDDRFTGERQQEILEIIGNVLGREPRVQGSGQAPDTNGVNGGLNGHG